MKHVMLLTVLIGVVSACDGRPVTPVSPSECPQAVPWAPGIGPRDLGPGEGFQGPGVDPYNGGVLGACEP